MTLCMDMLVDLSKKSVLILAANADDRLTNVRNGLQALLRNSVSISCLNARDNAPKAEDFKKHDVIITWAGDEYKDHKGTGTLLADFVDHGGLAVVAHQMLVNRKYLGGRWKKEHYSPLPAGPEHSGQKHKLGRLLVPESHALLREVKSFDGGPSSIRVDCRPPVPDCELIAEWDDGMPLVGTMKRGKGRVTSVNMYPVSSDVASGFWLKDTDGFRLLANAVLYR